MSLASEILADSPRRFYKLDESGTPLDDLGSDGTDISTTQGAPLYDQTGGIPSAPGDTAIFYDGVDDAHRGTGTGVASDAGGGSAKAFAMMLVFKADASVLINDWLFSEGSSASATPLFGFFMKDSNGRPGTSLRTADNQTRELNATIGTDIRDEWHLFHWESDPTDATNGVRLYIDGTLEATGAPLGYGATATTFDRMAVGGLWRNSGAATNFGPGTYQYAATYDHALGQTRVTAHWDAFNATAVARPLRVTRSNLQLM